MKNGVASLTYNDREVSLLEAIALNSPDHIILHDTDLRFQKVINPLIGYTVEEMIGRTDYDILPDSTARKLVKLKKEVLRNGRPGHFSTSLLSRSGKEEYIEGVLIPVRDKDGKISGLISYFRDVTEIKEQEAEIYRTLESIRDGFFALDKDWRFVYVNDAAEILIGSEREELIGRNHWEVYPEAAGTLIETNYEKAADGEMMEWDNYYAPWDRWFHIRAYPREGGGVSSFFQDITERKKMEAALRESEMRNTLLLENSLDGILLTTHDGKIEIANPAVCRMTEMTYKELSEVGMGGIVDTGDPGFQDLIMVMRMTGQGVGEVRLRQKVGSFIPVEITASNYRNLNGEVRTSMIIRDIRERKKVESEREEMIDLLKISEQKHRIVADYTHDWEYWLDPGQKFIYCSPSCYKITGYHSSEFMADHELLIKCIHPEDREVIIKHKHTLSKHQNIQELSFRIIRSDGSVRWIGHVCQDIYNEQGIYLGRRGSNRDITERLEADNNLKISEEKYRMLAENTADIIWMSDASGKYTYVSPAVEKLYGFKPEEILGKSLMEMVKPSERSGAERAYSEFVKSTNQKPGKIEPSIAELQQVRKDGTLFWIEVLFKPLFDHKNCFTGYLGVTRDISERKKAQLQAEQHIREQMLIATISEKLVGMANRDEVYYFIGRELHKLVGDSYVVMSKYNPESKALKLNYAFGFKHILKNLRNQFGIDPFLMAMPIDGIAKEVLEKFKNRKLNLLKKDGIHYLSGGKINKKTGKAMEKYFGIKSVYILGITWNDKLYGAVGILAKDDTMLAHHSLIETIINQASMAMQRLYTSEELARSEKRYRTLVEMSPDGIGVFDTEGMLISSNRELARMIGYEDETNFMHSLIDALEYIAPADRKRVRKNIRLRAKGQMVPIQVYKLQRRDGSTFPAEVKTVLVQDESGKPKMLSIIRDITERKRAEEELERFTEQLRKYAGYNESIREKERLNLARDIHDILGSSLAGLKMELAILKRQISSELKEPGKAIFEHVEAMSAQIDESVEIMRKIVRELRPGILDELGLTEAIRWYASEIEKRSGIQCNTTVDELMPGPNLQQSIIIFRIFQEIMTNAVLHSRASQIRISLVKIKDKVMRMTIADNGIGISGKDTDKSDSFGILGIKERTLLLNGKLRISGKRGKGTSIVVEIPLISSRHL